MNEWIIGLIGLVASITGILAFFGISAFNQFWEYRRVSASSKHKTSASSKHKSKDNSCEALAGKLLRWFMFSIVLSLLPLAMKIISLLARDYEFSWGSIVSHGELLIIAITMCTTAIAELFCSGAEYKLRKLFAGSLTISVLIIASGSFSDISVAFELSQSEKLNATTIFVQQLVLFTTSFFLGVYCIFLSET